ncbi:MAG TPA: UDP-glucose/GDP-mannose dehydrogenase family protein [Elusimicrobiales bacterium]|nr:UDP-glucose/GDP-mannose dehydrogenase family protein [Elusimicrobiales bacterium]
MKKFNVCVIGTGYVGLVTGTCLAEIGHRVVCVDSDKNKIARLNNGKVPIYETGLEKLVVKNTKAKRLFFTTSVKSAMDTKHRAEIIFIAVGTPPRDDGSADLSFVEDVSAEIAKNMTDYTVIVEKSTVPVETGIWIEKTITRLNQKKIPFDVVSNPEFLREGSAVADFLKPDRIIVGTSSAKAKDAMKKLYAPIKSPILFTNIKSAEIIKHASNSFLACKISFINAVANVCERTGANVEDVAKGMGLDKRIGKSFLNAGVGFGGFCFPKDLQAFGYISKDKGYDFALLKEVQRINEEQKMWIVKKCHQELWNLAGKTIAILGLAFKPNTDDIRFAPSIDIIRRLQKLKAKVKVYDPKATENAKKILKKITFCKTPYECVKNADCAAIVTEWDEIKNLDLSKTFDLMKHPIIIDGRNIFHPLTMRKKGFTYHSVGRV